MSKGQSPALILPCVCTTSADVIRASIRLCLTLSRPRPAITLQARRDPMGPDTLSPFGSGSGRFFFYSSGSDRTRAHLASRLLLCPNTCTPHTVLYELLL